MADIDQATSVQDVENVGAVFGDYQMSFETFDSPIAMGLMKIMNPEFKKNPLAGQIQPDVDRKTDLFHNIRFLQDHRLSEEGCWHERSTSSWPTRISKSSMKLGRIYKRQ